MGLIYILIWFVGTETAVGRRFESDLKQTILITLKEIFNKQLKIKHDDYFKNGIIFKKC